MAADAGTLRERASRWGASSDATRRVRRRCLRELAAAAGVPDPVPDTVAAQPPRTRAAGVSTNLALDHLRERAGRGHAAQAVRAAAMAALTREVGLRTGELASLLVTSIDLGARTLTYRPDPPADPRPQPEVTVPLSPGLARLLSDWLDVRRDLVAMTPRTKHLWVSVAANHDGFGVRRPPGLALHPNGVRRAHARAVAACNAELVGYPGFEPLPRTPGSLRPEHPKESSSPA